MDEKALKEINLPPGPERPCPYLPNRLSRESGFIADILPAGIYHSLMNLGFRRSGRAFYKPSCAGCNQCQPIRVCPERFKPNRSQVRNFNQNKDIVVRLTDPTPNVKKFELYKKYVAFRHEENKDRDDYEDFCAFLYQSPIQTLEVCYYLEDQLIGVAILDREPCAFSSVYCYFDPDFSKRGLGVFNILWTLQYAKSQKIPWVYLGYYIKDSEKMNYKAHFKPHEILSV